MTVDGRMSEVYVFEVWGLFFFFFLEDAGAAWGKLIPRSLITG